MAIWQLSFKLIPADGHFYEKDILLGDVSTSILSSELPVNQSWCEENKLFGCLDTTCVEICIFNSMIDEISVRMDIRSLSKSQLDCIIKFAQFNNLQISHDEKVLMASIDNVLSMICNSNALRYVEDPRQFFMSLSMDGEDVDN